MSVVRGVLFDGQTLADSTGSQAVPYKLWQTRPVLKPYRTAIKPLTTHCDQSQTWARGWAGPMSVHWRQLSAKRVLGFVHWQDLGDFSRNEGIYDLKHCTHGTGTWCQVVPNALLYLLYSLVYSTYILLLRDIPRWGCSMMIRSVPDLSYDMNSSIYHPTYDMEGIRSRNLTKLICPCHKNKLYS